MAKILGRNFDDNDNEEELNCDIEMANTLLERFSNLENVLENASLTAALMYYLFNKSLDFNPLLFYYVIRKYEKLNETKNTVKNYEFIHMEIFSVFLHTKSILPVQIKNEELLRDLEETVQIRSYTTVFDRAGKYILKNIMQPYLEKFKQSISHGLESYSFQNKLNIELDRMKELSILETLHETIRKSLVRNQKIRCLPHQNQDMKNVGIFQDFQIKAIFQALHTQYEYFIRSKKYSYLKNIPNSDSQKTFLSNTYQFPRKKLKIKSHSFIEFVPSMVVQCNVCDTILWGSSPQGLMCSYCENAIHPNCKDLIKACPRHKSPKSPKTPVDPNVSVDKEITNEDQVDSGMSELSRKFSKIMNKENSANKMKQLKTEMSINTDYSGSGNDSPGYKFLPKQSSTPLKKIQEFSTFYEEKIKKASIKSSKSMHSNESAKLDADIIRSKSARTPSPDQSKFQNNSSRRVTDILKTSESDLESGNSNVAVEPLILCEWESDEEMKVTETFEPEIELMSFPSHIKLTTSKNKEQYSRLLVLMEFHHKTKFIRMILKRFKYLLVDRWNRFGEFLDLYESLSLGCIEELYILLKSLVETMDRSKQDDTYDSSIAENVYKWLTDEDDKNIRCWLRLSVDLCCTNILQSVKTSVAEQKKLSQKLNELLSVEYNRLIIIEQLANMRPLLFNLPMIVLKIVKDLKRYSQFKDEAAIWEEVQQKLKYLPTFIDERCMPIVELINNGTVTCSSLKYQKSNKYTEKDYKLEKFTNNFPRTIFKENFVDFQFVLISNLRELYSDNSNAMQSTVYTREEIEAAAICYENKMIILQKDNEKYLLKLFKSLNQKKMNPIISFERVHVTKQMTRENKNYPYELTILLIDQAVLVQILFKEGNARDMWFDHIIEKSKKNDKHLNLNNRSCSTVTQRSVTYSEEETNKKYVKTVSNITPILENLGNVSILLEKTVDMLPKKMYQEIDTVEKNMNTTPESLDEVCRIHLELFQEHGDFVTKMFQQRQGESTPFAERENLCNFREFITRMIKLADLKEQNLINSYDVTDNSAEIREDYDGASKKTFNNIQEYIEYIISQAKSKIVLEDQLFSNAPSKLLRQNAENEWDEE